MTNDHYIVVVLGHDTGAEAVVRVAVDDRLHRLLAERPNRFQQLLAVLLRIAGVEDDQPVFRLDDDAGRDQVPPST